MFGHALNTVNKIRTGSQKPPASERLRLYGLYKQAMEGDVAYVQSRPLDDDKKELDKWDAWATNAGLSRTQAKRQYIETLIHTMHTYASATPEARELVAELEFVWDQVRNNSNPSGSSDASSPLRVVHEQRNSYPGMVSSSAAAFAEEEDEDVASRPLRVLSPVSQADEDELDEDRDEFVDAPISQFDDTEDAGAEHEDEEETHHHARQPPTHTRDQRWRKRIESAMIKMTAEVAALREQLESRDYVAEGTGVLQAWERGRRVAK